MFHFCTKCLVSFLYEMSVFAFVQNVRLWSLYEMSCVRNVVCTNCRAPVFLASFLQADASVMQILLDEKPESFNTSLILASNL